MKTWNNSTKPISNLAHAIDYLTYEFTMNGPPDFLSALDLGVFRVESQTSDNDKRTLLSLQRIVSARKNYYNYLEIGSAQGGSLVPYIADPRCSAILSVDPRPIRQPDERGQHYAYPENGEAQMLKNLSELFSETQMSRLRCIKLDIKDVTPSPSEKIDIALIDGEHTNVACFSDAAHLLRFLSDDSIIAFHDSDLITDAIQNFEQMLNCMEVNFQTAFLRDNVAAIGLGKYASILSNEFRMMSYDRDFYFNAAKLNRWKHIAITHQEPELKDDHSAQITSLQNENDLIRNQMAEIERELLTIKNSSFWRATAPFRRRR